MAAQDGDATEGMLHTNRPPDEWDLRCELWHRLWIAYRYHRRREAWFDKLDKATTAISVLLGATILAKALECWLPFAASVIAGLGFLSLVFNYSSRRVLHNELAVKLMLLIADIEGVPIDDLTMEQVAMWKKRYAAEVSTKEPPMLKALAMACEYEQAIAVANPKPPPKVPGWRLLFANMF
ncbi:hypothetical protein [Hydrogenophaga sp.]|uniref:hypothetical protein n=1 Tax=Hydrogenophaga sp. TaxID=1904254 RepID=UPI0025C60BB2|nr:hypothetical protein [Hydrogenophaga sp.]MBT9462534.1 hypothetical protein [Hydrogenophaga sp.]